MAAFCPACGAPTPAAARFCSSCGAALPKTQAPTPEAPALRRLLTLVFMDLVGSTDLAAETELEIYDGILKRYHQLAAEAVESHGGRVLQLYGDGVLACFGLEEDAENAALSALASARAVTEAAPERVPGIQVRAGVHSGAMMCRIDESGLRQPEVSGLDVNVASRIEGQARPGGVAFSEATLNFVRRIADVPAEDIGLVKLKGLREPMRLYMLGEGSLGPAAPAEADALLEREDIIQALVEGVAGAKAAPNVALLVGAPGIGKSAILAEISRRLDNSYRKVDLSARLNLRHTPLHPLADWLARTLGYGRFPLDPGVTTKDLAGRLAMLAPSSAESRAEVTAEILGVAEAAALSTRYAPPQLRELRVEALAEIVGEVMAGGPTLLVVDDLHWIDDDSRAVVDRILEQGARENARIILTSRPDAGLTDFAEKHGLETIRLAPLSRDAAHEILARSGAVDSGANEAERIVVLAEGNPLFLRTLLELVRREGGAMGAGSLPPTIEATFQGVLNALGPARALALDAAVVGRQFSEEELHWLGSDPEETNHRLGALAGAGLIEPAGEAWQFSHILLQEAAYAMAPPSRVREAHARFAAALKERDPARAAAMPEVVADHLIAAQDAAGIVEAGVHAGLGFLKRASFGRAAHYLEHSLSALDALGEGEHLHAPRLSALTLLAAAKVQSFGFAHPETREAYLKLDDAAGGAGSQGLERVQALYGLFAHRIISGEVRASGEVVERMGRAAVAGDAAHEVLRLVNVCAVALYSGRFDACLEAADRLKEIYDPASHGTLFLSVGADPLISVLTAEANVQGLRDRPDEVRRLTNEALEHADVLGATLQLPWIRIFNGGALMMTGEIEEATEWVGAGLELAQNQGAAFWILNGLSWLAVLASERGTPETAPADLGALIAQSEAIGVGLNLAHLRSVHAMNLQTAGRAEEARAEARTATRQAARGGQGQWTAEIWRNLARVLAAQGDARGAEIWRERALAMARRQRAVAVERRILEDASAA